MHVRHSRSLIFLKVHSVFAFHSTEMKWKVTKPAAELIPFSPSASAYLLFDVHEKSSLMKESEPRKKISSEWIKWEILFG